MDTKKVLDRIALKAEIDVNGFLRAPAIIGRSGVQSYRNPDGSWRKEYRPPDEVFAQDSLDTLKLLPVTYLHPPEFLTPENAKQYTVGTLGETQSRSNQWIKSTLGIHDKETLDRIKDGVLEISLGYTRKIDATPGITSEGEKYDLIQRDIRYNHVAILPKGRAQGAKLLLDAAEQITQGNTLKKITVGGITFEVEEQLFDALESDRKVNDELLNVAATDNEKLQARGDTLQAKLDEAQKVIDSVDSTDDIRKAVSVRLKLEKLASTVLDGVDLTDMSERDVHAAVVAKQLPKLDIAEKSDAYLATSFDIAMSQQTDALDEARDIGNAAVGSALGSSIDEARKAMLARNATRANALKGDK